MFDFSSFMDRDVEMSQDTVCKTLTKKISSLLFAVGKCHKYKYCETFLHLYRHYRQNDFFGRRFYNFYSAVVSMVGWI